MTEGKEPSAEALQSAQEWLRCDYLAQDFRTTDIRLASLLDAFAYRSRLRADEPISDTRPAPDALPCPFCGSPDIHNWTSRDHGGEPSWSAMCMACECEGPHTDDEIEAIRLWNCRGGPLRWPDEVSEITHIGWLLDFCGCGAMLEGRPACLPNTLKVCPKCGEEARPRYQVCFYRSDAMLLRKALEFVSAAGEEA